MKNISHIKISSITVSHKLLLSKYVYLLFCVPVEILSEII